MKDLAFCEEWGEKLAARHPEDLSPKDRADLHLHMSECSQCSAAYATFNDVEARLHNLPQARPLLSHFPDLGDIERDYPPPPAGVGILYMHIKCADRFYEVLPEEVESAELTVEEAVSHILLDLFGKGAVDEVTIRFPSNLRMGLQYCSIDIRAQYFYQFFALLPRTKENMKQALVKSISSMLKELFGWVNIESVSLVQECEGEHQINEREQHTRAFWVSDGGYFCT